jgi:hypothetical protein
MPTLLEISFRLCTGFSELNDYSIGNAMQFELSSSGVKAL